MYNRGWAGIGQCLHFVVQGTAFCGCLHDSHLRVIQAATTHPPKHTLLGLPTASAQAAPRHSPVRPFLNWAPTSTCLVHFRLQVRSLIGSDTCVGFLMARSAVKCAISFSNLAHLSPQIFVALLLFLPVGSVAGVCLPTRRIVGTWGQEEPGKSEWGTGTSTRPPGRRTTAHAAPSAGPCQTRRTRRGERRDTTGTPTGKPSGAVPVLAGPVRQTPPLPPTAPTALPLRSPPPPLSRRVTSPRRPPRWPLPPGRGRVGNSCPPRAGGGWGPRERAPPPHLCTGESGGRHGTGGSATPRSDTLYRPHWAGASDSSPLPFPSTSSLLPELASHWGEAAYLVLFVATHPMAGAQRPACMHICVLMKSRPTWGPVDRGY